MITQREADMFVKRMLLAGLDHVTPNPLPISHPDAGTDCCPRAFVFDGASGVPDVSLEEDARHDWLYLYGRVNGVRVSKSWCDQYYRGRLYNRGMKIRGTIRYLGLAKIPPTCWISKRIWNSARRRDLSVHEIFRDRVLPDPGGWIFPNGSWMLEEARYIGG